MVQKKKGKSGAATTYITRNRCLRKLQISLADFRRLCIIKGIYPREPKSLKKVSRGNRTPRTYYHAKDIRFLSHEPLLQKFRENKIFLRKLSKARAKRDSTRVSSLKDNARPDLSVDHIVKERYPTFIDAVRDLDDALCMLFLFAMMPVASETRPLQVPVVEACARLSAEFQHYVVQKRVLRKTFVSIKGIYYQADIHGQSVTWLVPHKFPQAIPSDVDFRVMLTFLEFYQTLVGFVNFKLYSDAGLVYPPTIDAALEAHGADADALLVTSQDSASSSASAAAAAASTGAANSAAGAKFSKEQLSDIVEKIGQKSKTSTTAGAGAAADDDDADSDDEQNADGNDDEFVSYDSNDQDQQLLDLAAIQREHDRAAAASRLFEGKIFFLSREVPRESLSFVIYSLGGRVGWDETVAAGSPFGPMDARITHYIIDRPRVPNDVANIKGRVFIQPQWVYDTLNARRLLAASSYAPGARLPAHLSPFVQYAPGDYVPAQARAMSGEQFEGTMEAPAEEALRKSAQESDAEEDNDEDDDEEEVIEGDSDDDSEIDSDEDEDAAAVSSARRRQAELAAERAGASSNVEGGKRKKSQEQQQESIKAKKAKTRAQTDVEVENANMKKAKLAFASNRQRKMYEKISKAETAKTRENERLATRRAELDAAAGKPQRTTKKTKSK
ncbi:hypothetical protein GQ42DRAFT_161421 [Ramicandelaber brevisporus]|nr:hypothetical protein GQ42DRAFT_161421 [Ramicandelaber brevisporus]